MNTCILIRTREVTTSAKLNGTIACLGHIQTLFRTNSHQIIYPVQDRKAKNHTLSSGTYPYRSYKGVPPPQPGHKSKKKVCNYILPVFILFFISECDIQVKREWKDHLANKVHLENLALLVTKATVVSPFKAQLVWMEAVEIEESQVKREIQDPKDLQVRKLVADINSSFGPYPTPKQFK